MKDYRGRVPVGIVFAVDDIIQQYHLSRLFVIHLIEDDENCFGGSKFQGEFSFSISDQGVSHMGEKGGECHRRGDHDHSPVEVVDDNNIRVLAHIISNLVYQRVTGEKGYFDTRLVYIAEEKTANNTSKRIAIMDYDGNNHEYLTNGNNIAITPRVSPDGKKIAYLSFSNKKPTVFLLDLDTKKEKTLGNFSGMSFAPRFSPDNKKIIFSLTKRGSSNIFVQKLSNNETIQITNNRHINTSPSFSPDNKWIVFSSDRSGKQNLYIKKSDAGISKKAKRITFGNGSYATPVWSPRGDYIAFTKTYRNEFFIGLIKKDGSGERVIATGYLTESPSWSPNGRTLIFNKVYKSNNKLVSSLFTIDITGNLEKKLNTPGEASDPDWGPSINY